MVLWIRNGELEDSYAFLVHLIILVWRELHLILDFHLVAGYMISPTWISVCFRASLPSTAFLRSSIIGWGCFTVKHIPYKCLHMPLYLKKKEKEKNGVPSELIMLGGQWLSCSVSVCYSGLSALHLPCVFCYLCPSLRRPMFR